MQIKTRGQLQELLKGKSEERILEAEFNLREYMQVAWEVFCRVDGNGLENTLNFMSGVEDLHEESLDESSILLKGNDHFSKNEPNSHNPQTIFHKGFSDKKVNVASLAMGDHARGRPRTCTAEDADEVSSVCDCGKVPALVADLAINPETGQAEPVNIQPIYNEVDMTKLREQMQQLLDMIMLFFEEEEKLVDSGTLQVEETLFHDVQTNDSSTQSNIRSLPPQFKSRRT